MQYISEGQCITFPWNVTNLATLASSDVDVHCDRRVTRVDATCTLSTTFPSDATFASKYFSFQTIHNIVYVYLCTLSATFPSDTTFASDATFALIDFSFQTIHNIVYVCAPCPLLFHKTLLLHQFIFHSKQFII